MAASSSNPASNDACSLYVGDLHPDATEAAIFEKFSAQAPVMSIGVTRDQVTHRSLRYAYVTFKDPKDAEKCMDVLNFEPLFNRPMHIMWSPRDAALRQSGGCTKVFIKNLDRALTTSKDVHDAFRSFGEIVSCKVACDDSGQSRGYGYVHFTDREAAQSAIDSGVLVNDRKVVASRFMSPREHIEKLGSTSVYIKNFPDDIDGDEKLEAMFESFGKIFSAKVMFDESGKARGFGFCNFESPSDAEKAIREMNGKPMGGGKNLHVERHVKRDGKPKDQRGKTYPGVNLYVKNIDDTIDDDRLEKEFSSYGSITSVKVMRDDRGHSKGFGFVCFASSEDAGKALREMSGKMIGTKPLYVALAQRKEDRQAQLSQQYTHAPPAMLMQQPPQQPPQQQQQAAGQQMPVFQPQVYYPMPPPPPQAAAAAATAAHPRAPFMPRPSGMQPPPPQGRFQQMRPPSQNPHGMMPPAGAYGANAASNVHYWPQASHPQGQAAAAAYPAGAVPAAGHIGAGGAVSTAARSSSNAEHFNGLLYPPHPRGGPARGHQYR
ncbi:polyadenylate-binding protein 4-like isoform X2 [Sycon ciliatum]|uniref:polyadenylate-binding protein 4-like isoform X2 n=1 Tax=Sycon ciliatum TaxID=27933 RepID=UPI0031F6D0E2|eukprot:scpid77538/ scgid30187/ Polyadenylate-binding protein 1